MTKVCTKPAPWQERPQKKKGSRDGTSQTNPETFRCHWRGEAGGGGGQGVGRGGGHLLTVRVHLGQTVALMTYCLQVPTLRGNVCPAHYFSINYPDFSPRFTLSWRSPPSRPRCTAHLPYKARCIIKQYL